MQELEFTHEFNSFAELKEYLLSDGEMFAQGHKKTPSEDEVQTMKTHVTGLTNNKEI